MSPESILAHLVPLLTSQVENVATESLAHLMLEYKYLHGTFLKFISSTGIAFPDNLTIKTQARWQDPSIPDLVGLDDLGRHLLIVEGKFWATLTSNQPETYIDRMPADKPAILLFIATASRIPTLWKELLSRCGFLPVEIRHIPGTPDMQIHTQQIDSLHLIGLTSWESILNALYQKAEQESDGYAIADIWQVQSLCKILDASAFQPLSKGELVSPTKMRIAQFKELIDKLVTRLVDAGIVIIGGYKATPGPNYYKRYMTISGLYNWCIEYNELYRNQFPEVNIWLSNLIRPENSSVLPHLSPISYKVGKTFLIPLELPTSVEGEAVLTSLFEQVTAIANRMKK